MQDEARAKRHSTTAEAMSVAAQSRAYRTILTHFSTRYPTMPAFDMTTRPDVAVAMDFMTVNLADLPWLPGIVKPLDDLFKMMAADWEADDVGAGPAEGGTTVAGSDGSVVEAAKGSKKGKTEAKAEKSKSKEKKHANHNKEKLVASELIVMPEAVPS